VTLGTLVQLPSKCGAFTLVVGSEAFYVEVFYVLEVLLLSVASPFALLVMII